MQGRTKELDFSLVSMKMIERSNLVVQKLKVIFPVFSLSMRHSPHFNFLSWFNLLQHKEILKWDFYYQLLHHYSTSHQALRMMISVKLHMRSFWLLLELQGTFQILKLVNLDIIWLSSD